MEATHWRARPLIPQHKWMVNRLFYRITRYHVDLPVNLHQITRHFVNLCNIRLSRHLQMLSRTFLLVYDLTEFPT